MQIRPLEEVYKFGAFFSSYLNESDFYAKPSVLLLGQYSTGARMRQTWQHARVQHYLGCITADENSHWIPSTAPLHACCGISQ